MGLKELGSVRTRGVLGGLAAAAIVAATASGAAALTLPTLSPTTTSSTSTATTTHSSSSKSAAGQPTASSDLLCGTWTPATDRMAGNSNIDHPFGASAAGSVYAYTSQNCESPGSSTGSFTWTLSHSNVNVSTERGTEHGEFVLNSGREAGFDGHITNYDFSTPLTTAMPDACGSREIFYASGHAYDSAGSCSPSGPGNFNTHGGAQVGQHYRGTYGTVVYQDDNNNQCPYNNGSGTTYCFEAILQGQTN